MGVAFLLLAPAFVIGWGWTWTWAPDLALTVGCLTVLLAAATTLRLARILRVGSDATGAPRERGPTGSHADVASASR